MAQQELSTHAGHKYRKKLFVEEGKDYTEVGGRIIEPYVPPEPVMKNKEHVIVTGVSQLSGIGISSYKAKLRVMFKDKKEYSKYIMLAEGIHKFYDEKGAIFLGSLEGIQVSIYEAATKYVVDINLNLIKKDEYDRKDRGTFVDLVNPNTGVSLDYAEDVNEMTNLGLISTYNMDGSPVMYFRGGDYSSRAEFIAMINRTRRWIEQSVRR